MNSGSMILRIGSYAKRFEKRLRPDNTKIITPASRTTLAKKDLNLATHCLLLFLISIIATAITMPAAMMPPTMMRIATSDTVGPGTESMVKPYSMVLKVDSNCEWEYVLSVQMMLQ